MEEKLQVIGPDLKRVQKKWLGRISREEKAHKDFRDHAEDVEDVFNDFSEDDLYVPLYWQVVQIEHVGVYSNQPVPDVRPRSEIQNPLHRSIATIVERGLSYCVDNPSFDTNMHRAVDDYLSIGIGVMRVKVDSIINHSTHTVPVFAPNPMTGEQMQIGQRLEQKEEVGDQHIRWEYVPWRRFGWEPCNNWKECEWIYFRHRMTRAQAKERFGKEVKGSNVEHNVDATSWKAKSVDIYEIWCKKKREVIFVAKGEAEPLEVIPDPLELIDFFPIPTPMMTNIPSEELIPQPDYDYIEAYDTELNRLQERRMGLLEQIKASGAYDKGIPELAEMLENDDGEYSAVQNLMGRISQAGGPDGIIYHLPLAEKSEVLRQLTDQIQFVRQQVDEVLGISDIVRGVTSASETATAQEIKGRWVGIRLTRKRETVQYSVREMMRIMAQLLVSHITPDNLQRMTQMPITEQMMQMLSNDMMMEFSVDIELDSTVAKDEFRERETRQEMLNGIAQFSQSVLPMVQQNMLPSDTASAILRAALTPYARYDRGLEESLTALPTSQKQLQQLGQQLQQAQQQLQQTQQQMQQWQMIAQQLQQQATTAKAAKETADAEKKRAETDEIRSGLDADRMESQETAASIAYKRAQAIESLARADEILEAPTPPLQ